MLSSLQGVFLTFVKNQVPVIVCPCNCVLSSAPLAYGSVSVPVTWHFYDCSFVVWLEPLAMFLLLGLLKLFRASCASIWTTRLLLLFFLFLWRMAVEIWSHCICRLPLIGWLLSQCWFFRSMSMGRLYICKCHFLQCFKVFTVEALHFGGASFQSNFWGYCEWDCPPISCSVCVLASVRLLWRGFWMTETPLFQILY